MTDSGTAGPGAWRRMGLLGSLYVAQALPVGFTMEALPVLLRESGSALWLVGASRLLLVPWIVKFLWAPLVDRWGMSARGRRRAWLLPTQGLAALVMLCCAALGFDEHLYFVIALLFLANVLCATQDIATDALACDMLGYEQRSYGNAVQAVGFQLGLLAGGGLSLVAYGHYGWRAVMGLMALALVLPLAPVLLMREPKPAGKVSGTVRLAAYVDFLRRPGMPAWLAVVFLYLLGSSWAIVLVSPFLVDSGYSEAQIGWLKGVAGFSAALLGSALGSMVINAAGRRNAFIGIGLFMAAAIALYLAPVLVSASRPLVYAAVCVNKFAGGMGAAVLFTMMMDQCSPRQAGTDFTVQQSVHTLAGIFAGMSGVVAGAFGYAGAFVCSAAICGLVVLWASRRIAWAAFMREAAVTAPESKLSATPQLPPA